MFKRISAVAAVIALSGCSVLAPTTAVVGLQHVSHPLAGPPFGPRNEEDSLDQLTAGLRWEYGNVVVEQRLGYKYVDGGFYGPKLSYYGSVDYLIPLRKGK